MTVSPVYLAEAAKKFKQDSKLIEDTRPKPVEPKNRPKSEPVRNPAFREHEGLKDLQKQLHRNERKK